VVWPPDRLFLDGASLRPAESLRVAPGEAVEVAVRATPGQRVEARLPGQRWQPLVEAGVASGRYRALLSFPGNDEVEAAPVLLRISGVALPRQAGPHSITALTPGDVGQWRADPERLFEVGPDGADLLHGLHEVRLGGPNLAELPAGVLLQVTGRRGEHLRVQLAPNTTAWVAQGSVAPAAAGTRPPQASFTTLSVAGGNDGDVVNIPLAARVPYAVRAVADASGRQGLEVEIFNSHHALTWITHRASARVVREVTAEQAGPGRVRLQIALIESRLWGWRVERAAQALRIVVRAAPLLAAQGSPLAGLRVALEPGHGSAANLGAVGATAVPEKDVNRWAVAALKTELEAAGAQVTVVREADDNPTLRERARRVVESQAQLFVSVHANASDTSSGFLRSAGSSTYYKHSSSRDLAAAVQRRLLEQTGLDDFGLVGNFNYAPIRLVTWAPAILVEQAFMSHPGDEAKLLDPAFRAQLARAVRMGLEDFLRSP
jgi:N-acetylmuramoyl-L-alanine amidase